MKKKVRHILIAEDSVDDQVLLKRALEDAKKKGCGSGAHEFTYSMVENGAEARHYLKGDDKFADREKFPVPVLILSDLKMPLLDGFALIEWVRERRTMAMLPVVVFSSSDEPEDIDRAYRLGANTYFTKPGSLGELRRWAEGFTEYWCSLADVPDVRL